MAVTVYRLIQNPYMPQGTSAQTNSPTPFYAPGEIGCAFNEAMGGGTRLRVRADSGATSATPIGAIAAGQLAFWKDRANNLVTNDSRFADTSAGAASGFVNRVAGIFQLAVSTSPNTNGTDGQPLTYVCDLVVSQLNYPVASDGSGAAGEYAIADNTAATARVKALSTATTAPTQQTIGVIRGAAANNLINVDVAIGFID